MSVEEELSGAEVLTVERADLPELLAFAASCPEAPAWPAEAWRTFVARPASASGVRRKLLATRSPDGAYCGLIAFTLTDQTTELELLLVHPSWRRRGVGHRLAKQWLRGAETAGAAEALLEVRVSNLGAQRLYRNLGFEDQGWRVRYYHHPSEDALLMRCALLQSGR